MAPGGYIRAGEVGYAKRGRGLRCERACVAARIDASYGYEQARGHAGMYVCVVKPRVKDKIASDEDEDAKSDRRRT